MSTDETAEILADPTAPLTAEQRQRAQIRRSADRGQIY